MSGRAAILFRNAFAIRAFAQWLKMYSDFFCYRLIRDSDSDYPGVNRQQTMHRC